ncbi:MAG: hypothetical protein JO060_02775, partial [Candidatus Eremiobacteraeota bacterium]|nr:hypothetical protein [Candidatus Eremiobacteraeota bacterium]
MNLETQRASHGHALSAQRTEALQAYLEADYQRALDRLRAVPEGKRWTEDHILEARILLRLGDAARSGTVAAVAQDTAASVDERVLARALLAAALDRDGRSGHAAAAFREARAEAPKAHRTIRAELGYFEAVSSWSSGDLARAGRLVESALKDADDVVRALLLQLRGWIEIRRERYTQAAEHFDAALCASQRSRYRDVRLEARLIHALSVIATETIDVPLASRVDELATAFSWNDGVARERFNTTTCRRFAALLRGEMQEAYRLGLLAIELAPTAAFSAIAHTNHAALLRFVGDNFSSRYHFGIARRRIAETHWSVADVEEHVALANYAIEAAPADPASAAQALTIYRSVSAFLKRDLALERDRRTEGFGDFAEGRVAEALGDAERALDSYDRSLRCWSALGYRMRAAIVALDVARLSPDHRSPRETAAALERAPHAWFAKYTTAPPPSGR